MIYKVSFINISHRMPQIAGNTGHFLKILLGVAPQTAHTLGRYPYYTIPQIYLKDIPD